jgi:hypothetical protein
MSFEGIVHDGKVEVGNALPEGSAVRIVPVKPKKGRAKKKPTLKSLLRLAGALKGMPSDLAAQHDHYIHGTPKR